MLFDVQTAVVEPEPMINILIVDDNEHNLLTLQSMLSESGYNIVKATSGLQALKHLVHQEFAVILLDINMPGMDGFETASVIRGRERTQGVPIIFITAFYGDELNVFKGYSVGAVDYIVSPIIPEILSAKVAIFVDLFRKTEKVKIQSERLREAEMLEHRRKLAEAEQSLEIEKLRIKEEHSKRERILETKNAELLAAKATELERSNAELEQFASVASHDLQEPLRTISNFCGLLEQHYAGKLDEESSTYIKFLVDASKRMHLMIKSLLLYSRVNHEKPPLAIVDCNVVLADTLKAVNTAINECNALISCDPMPEVMADRLQIAQVFQNLVSNALKFRGNRRPIIHVAVERQNGFWVFCVKDNGIGIEPNYFEKLFIIFQRLHGGEKYPGTGIGLALCKKIVERYGGRIWVESELGSGAKFYFSLPAIQEPQSESEQAA